MYNNPYYNINQGFNPTSRFQPMDSNNQQMNSYIPPIQSSNQPTLLGKSVDSIDVVKAMDIPLDGSISYFPLTDGSAIVTKKLQTDGTSKTIVYKPVEEEKKELPKYVTIEELRASIKEIDLSDIDDLKDDIKDLKQEIKDLKKSKKKDD